MRPSGSFFTRKKQQGISGPMIQTGLFLKGFSTPNHPAGGRDRDYLNDSHERSAGFYPECFQIDTVPSSIRECCGMNPALDFYPI
jgi:hypothetical protein